ncbi:spore gernimation protein GerPD [Peribacillus alkalitolerans]|uniref:spore gernimation protein GerPD n=1 Tax=Peribacillus alkalitolerans TaxID=1550385 RepID=UPI0013D2C692|nr:spore gernimation protein GerPD [Peribacillus alkalitolerans]
MELHVTNENLCVGNIQVSGVASSALFLIGDVNTVQLSSAFDTPPESMIIGPLVPLVPKG